MTGLPAKIEPKIEWKCERTWSAWMLKCLLTGQDEFARVAPPDKAI